MENVWNYSATLRKACLFLLMVLFSALPAFAGDSLNVVLSAAKATYSPGEDVVITAQLRYEDGTAVRSLEESKIKLKDSRGETVTEASMQKKQDGVFAFTYRLQEHAATGSWRAKAHFHSHEGDREGEWEGEVSNLFQVMESTPEEGGDNDVELAIDLDAETNSSSFKVGDTINIFAQALYNNGDNIDQIKRKVVVLRDASGTRVHRGRLIDGGNGNFIYSYQIPEGFEPGVWKLIVRIADSEDRKAVTKLALNVAADDSEPPVDPKDVDDDGDGYSENQGDCNDNLTAINPGAEDICGDGVDQDCSGADLACPIDPNDVDDDNDGYTENQGDCNDTNASINPAAEDICGDDIDQDCSGADLACPIDPNDVDNDNDGYTKNQGDCNDNLAAINPGAEDICGDDIDQDCSGADLVCPIDPNDVDDDNDGYTENQGDCNDNAAAVNPGADEVLYNGVDENCNGMSDDVVDADADGFTSDVDCNDADLTIYPGAEDICGDGIDQDCSGADLACPVDPNDVDDDGDGYSENQGDCNDTDVAINPGAEEITGNGIDENCNGMGDDEPVYSDHHFNNPDCLMCHTSDANEIHGSVHYQWQGDAPYMTNGAGLQGKLTNSVNSYCINIMGNWNGCSGCHIGKGAMPEPVATQAQLENIDCLKCHSEPGVRPTRTDCLNCHAKAGGGDAVKRGDLALATGTTTDRNFDVHMATTGGDMQCSSCHTTQNHRIAGKGSDLRPTDLDTQVACSNCHGSSPHASSTTNRHTARIACQTCHIPVYAKDAADTSSSEATETHRTWLSTHSTTPPFHPASEMANDLTPKYKFWNGDSSNYLLGDVAQLDAATGAYPTSRPEGSVNDGKLYPFKYKTAEQPITTGSRQLIALDTSVFFASADADEATRQGLVNMGMSAGTAYEWVLTDTYQLLNHQVSPKAQSLQCNNCHGTTSRMDLKGELGYGLKGSMNSVCSQCHGNESSKGFNWDHDKHVNDKNYDCSWCHSFTRPERGLRKP